MIRFRIIICVSLVIIFNPIHAQISERKSVNIRVKNVEILSLLELIGDKYDVGFMYNTEILSKDKCVSISLEDYSLEQICELLSDILNVDCFVMNSTIVLKSKEPNPSVDKPPGIKLKDISVNKMEREHVNEKTEEMWIELPEIQSINTLIYTNEMNPDFYYKSYSSIGYSNHYSNSRDKIGIGIFPLYSTYNNLKSNHFGIQTGILYDYKINHRYGLNTGCYFSSQYIKSDTVINNADSTGTLISEGDGKRIMYFIFPVNIRYNYSNNSICNLYINGGILMYLFRSNLHNSSAEANVASDFNWVGYLNLSTGIEKKLSEKLSIQAEPGIRFPLFSNSNNFKAHTNFGILFRLNYLLP